jgi:hypothetical protein
MGMALKISGGERLAETKQHFFRVAVSMSEQRNRMRAGRRGENSKRGCVVISIIFSTRTPGSIRGESATPIAKQMMDAAGINRLFLSKKPRIRVVVMARAVKNNFIYPR